jgi:hypothetical protein
MARSAPVWICGSDSKVEIAVNCVSPATIAVMAGAPPR